MIEVETVNYILTAFAIISALWGFRANMRAYKAENDKDIEQKTLWQQQITSLEKAAEDIHQRVSALEEDRHELRVLSDKVESIYRELDKKIDNLISILLKRGA